jgi:ABC-type phosphate transport system permease subunit
MFEVIQPFSLISAHFRHNQRANPVLSAAGVLAFIYGTVCVHALALSIPFTIFPLACVLEALRGIGADSVGRGLL